MELSILQPNFAPHVFTMSDSIKHECGLAFIRLRKPLSYYQQKYGSVMYGINKLYLLMEKQHNRGQDGAGIATIKLNVEPGYPFMYRNRSIAQQAIAQLFKEIGQQVNELEIQTPGIKNYPGLLKGHVDALGELMLGHLRYGTQGKNDVEYCHPFIKRDTIPTRNLAMAGNFNLVNTEELYNLVGINPSSEFHKKSDLAAMMEVVHHFLVKEDEANPGKIDVANILKQATQLFDGGYHIGGLIGNGDSFVMRDAHGIRPAYYYIHEDFIVAASERAAIRTSFNVGQDKVQPLLPGQALIVKANGDYEIKQILTPQQRSACSFERIYFSRGNDEKIYRERSQLGYNLSNAVLNSIDFDLKNTIFSFIPNTAEVAFYGLIKGMEDYLDKVKLERILSWGNNIDPEKLAQMIGRRIRVEKIAIKDVKMRTFITEDASRDEMVQHVYDITYGTVRSGVDTLVVIDDSIVRGTTLKQSIVTMLSRLEPKKIIVVSSAPQIRYPDCYGIDMSKMGDFIAFKAAIELLKEQGQTALLTDLYKRCKELQRAGQLHTENVVRNVYKSFTAEQISDKIAALITPENSRIPVQVIFQTIESLHQACPTNNGDWYFTGNYPTPGGNRVANRAFMNYMEGKEQRAY